MTPLERLQNIQRDEEITGWNIRLYEWSRSPLVLLGVACAVIGAGLGIGYLVQGKSAQGHPKAGAHATSLAKELAEPKPDLRRVVRALEAEPWDEGRLATEEALKKSALTSAEKSVTLAYWETLAAGNGEPGADLLYAAHWIEPLPMANELVGDLWRMQNDDAKARRYYEREIAFHDSTAVREKLVRMLLDAHDFASLSTMAYDEQYRAMIPERSMIMLEAHERRWIEIVAPLARLELGSWKPIPATLAIVSGLIWMLIALQGIQPPRWISFRSVVPFIAVLLGMASTFPTLFADLWESEILGLRHSGDIIGDFTFFMCGVGVREEILKLIFLLPLVPLLLVRKSRLEMLMIGACVGLGFAVQENLQYFASAGPVNAFGRFLTANFFHMAATGVISLAFCEALLAPKARSLYFAGTLVAVMVAHGAYDAFMAIPELHSLALVSTASFILLSRFFFDQLRRLRDGLTDHISIGGTLAVGMSVLVGVIFVCASMEMGFDRACIALGASTLGLLVVFIMFYRQLGQGMSAAAAPSGQPVYAFRS